MAVPAFLAPMLPEIGKALPYLALSLFKRKGGPPKLSEEDSELTRLRSQLAAQNLHRQAAMDENFKALAQGLFHVLPDYAKQGRTPPRFAPGPIYRPDVSFMRSGGSYTVDGRGNLVKR